jgi:hypothetical protein
MTIRFPFPVPANVIERLTSIAWQLWWSWQETQLTGCDPWAFGVPIRKLINTGVTHDDLTWLIGKNLLKCHSLNASRAPRPAGRTHIEATPIMLTDLGASFVEQYCLGVYVPCWDPHRRVLSVEGHPIKVYRQPADKQETVLSAFQEDGWIKEIDDPLPQGTDIRGTDAKVRLRQTVKNLNRAQQPSTILFSASGNGERITWSFRHEARHNNPRTHYNQAIEGAFPFDELIQSTPYPCRQTDSRLPH